RAASSRSTVIRSDRDSDSDHPTESSTFAERGHEAPFDDGPPAAIEAEIEAVVDRFVDSSLSGRAIAIEELIDAHPHLAPWLADRLELVAALWDAGRSRSRNGEVRCPHCGHPIALDASRSESSTPAERTASEPTRILCPA